VPKKYKALSSNPRAAKKREKKKRLPNLTNFPINELLILELISKN
jgi:hypothetical protein